MYGIFTVIPTIKIGSFLCPVTEITNEEKLDASDNLNVTICPLSDKVETGLYNVTVFNTQGNLQKSDQII